MRARGLKLFSLGHRRFAFLSRPMRARGLKHRDQARRGLVAQSRPMRARGLKRQKERSTCRITVVAPHAGAWIETLHPMYVIVTD